MGGLRFAFTTAAGLPSALSKQTIQMIRAQSCFRLGLIEAHLPTPLQPLLPVGSDEIPELIDADDAMPSGLQVSVFTQPLVVTSFSSEHTDVLLFDSGPGLTVFESRHLWPEPGVAGSDQTLPYMPRALTFTTGGSYLASTFSGAESPNTAEADSRLHTKPIERSSWTSPDDAASVRAVRLEDGAPSLR